MTDKLIFHPLPENAGVQAIQRYKNDYGASVIRGPYTYGGDEGFYEVAVLRFLGNGDRYELAYDTPIADDVLGYLTISEVLETLSSIEALPPSRKETQ